MSDKKRFGNLACDYDQTLRLPETQKRLKQTTAKYDWENDKDVNKGTILIADDEPLLRISFNRLLTQLFKDREIITCQSGEETLTKIETLPISSVILSDYNFNSGNSATFSNFEKSRKMNGLDLALCSMRERTRRYIGFIMMSAEYNVLGCPLTNQYQQKGIIDSTMSKPFSKNDLIEKINEVSNKKLRQFVAENNKYESMIAPKR